MDRKREKDQSIRIERKDAGNPAAGETVAIPVVEEQVQIGKRVVETGTVRISKKVHEEEVTVDEPILHDEVDVERVPINKYVETPPPAVRHEGDTMVIPVLREEVVVQKRLLLVEELRITRRQDQTQFPQKVTLRKEEVSVDRLPNPPATPGAEDA